METIVYIATTLEGYITRPEGELDWLIDPDFVDEGEDYGFTKLLDSVSCVVMGRHTFESLMNAHEWPCGNKRLVVMTQSMSELPEHTPETVELFAGEPAELVNKLALEGESKVFLDGGQLIRSFNAKGLVDRLILTRVPVLIGSGVPLFGALKTDIKWKHIRTQSYKSGLVQSEYIKK